MDEFIFKSIADRKNSLIRFTTYAHNAKYDANMDYQK